MDHKDLLKKVKEDDVKFISYQFTDVTGAVKSVDAPVKRLQEALEDGVWFDGSSVEGFARIQESDMLLIVDPDTYAVLPWTPQGVPSCKGILRYLYAGRRTLRRRSSRCLEKDDVQTCRPRLDLQRRS